MSQGLMHDSYKQMQYIVLLVFGGRGGPLFKRISLNLLLSLTERSSAMPSTDILFLVKLQILNAYVVCKLAAEDQPGVAGEHGRGCQKWLNFGNGMAFLK